MEEHGAAPSPLAFSKGHFRRSTQPKTAPTPLTTSQNPQNQRQIHQNPKSLLRLQVKKPCKKDEFPNQPLVEVGNLKMNITQKLEIGKQESRIHCLDLLLVISYKRKLGYPVRVWVHAISMDKWGPFLLIPKEDPEISVQKTLFKHI